MKLKDIQSRIIKDSRGEETIEVALTTDYFEVKASVPSGKSKGKYEARVIEPKAAIKGIGRIETVLCEEGSMRPEHIDKLLISFKDRIGANGALALSYAFWRAAAQDKGIELYQFIAQEINKEPKLPRFVLFNLINGGLHAKNSLPFQEYLLLPRKKLPSESLAFCFDFLENLKTKISTLALSSNIGDEGGFTIESDDAELGLKMLKEVLVQNYDAKQSFIGLDVAANSFFKEDHYRIGEKVFLPGALLDFYDGLAGKYPLLYLEDPFYEDGFNEFQKITAKLGEKMWIAGDDLTATNMHRIKKAKDKNAINTVIIKPNQIGTVSETIEAAKRAQSYGWKVVVSHRSGETMDDIIADLAVGLSATGFKAGSPLQPERLVKYKRLVAIENELTQQ